MEHMSLLHRRLMLRGRLEKVALCRVVDSSLHIQESHMYSACCLRVMELCMLNNLNRKDTELSRTDENRLEVEVMIQHWSHNTPVFADKCCRTNILEPLDSHKLPNCPPRNSHCHSCSIGLESMFVCSSWRVSR